MNKNGCVSRVHTTHTNIYTFHANTFRHSIMQIYKHGYEIQRNVHHSTRTCDNISFWETYKQFKHLKNINTFYKYCMILISLRALYMTFILTGIFSLSAALSLLFNSKQKRAGKGKIYKWSWGGYFYIKHTKHCFIQFNLLESHPLFFLLARLLGELNC